MGCGYPRLSDCPHSIASGTDSTERAQVFAHNFPHDPAPFHDLCSSHSDTKHKPRVFMQLDNSSGWTLTCTQLNQAGVALYSGTSGVLCRTKSQSWHCLV